MIRPYDATGNDPESARTVFCTHPDCQCDVTVNSRGHKSCGHGKASATHPDHEPVGLEERE